MKKYRASLKWVVAAVITVIALGLSFRQVNWRDAKQAFAQANYWWVALAVLSCLFSVYLLGWRWRLLLQPKVKVSLGHLFRLNIIAQYTNIIMPARLGEFLRAYLASTEGKAAGGFILGTVFLERILDFLVFVAFWLWLPAIFSLKREMPVPGLVRGGAGLTLVGLAMFAFRPQPFLKAFSFFARLLPLKWKEKAQDFFQSGIESFASLRRPGNVFLLLLMTALILLSQALTNYLVFFAFGLRLPFWAGLVVLLAIQVGNVPPSAPGKIGVFEYAVILALSLFFVEQNKALAYAVMLHIVAFLPKIVLGGIFAGRLHLLRLNQVDQNGRV